MQRERPGSSVEKKFGSSQDTYMSEKIFIKMMKNDVFQKASKSIQKHSGSHSGVPGHHFWRFSARKMTKMRNSRYYKIRPKNAGEWEKWGVGNQIFSANAEKLLRRSGFSQFPTMTRRAYKLYRVIRRPGWASLNFHNNWTFEDFRGQILRVCDILNI